MTSPRPVVVTMFRVAAVLVVITVLMGSMVAATESGAACPTWPGCYPGQFGPKLHLNPMVEFTHRIIAGVGLLTCVAAGVLGLRDPGVERWVKPLPFLAALGGAASAVFGALVVLIGISKAAGIVDLSAALVAMACAVVAAVRVSSPGSPWLRTRSSVGAAAMYGGLMALHGLGIAVAAPNSFTRVISWPVWAVVPGDLSPRLQVVRMVLAVAILAVAVMVLRPPWGTPRLPRALLAGFIVAELLVGLVVRGAGLSMAVAALYAGLAVGILACTALVGAMASVRTTAPATTLPRTELVPSA